MLFGTSPGYEAEQMLYLDALAKQIRAADGVTTLTDMHDEATKAIDAGKQTPDRSETVKDVILRNWEYDFTKCSSNGCDSTFKKENEFITCSRCIAPICSRCLNMTCDLEALNNSRLRIYCDKCHIKLPKSASWPLLPQRFV